MNYIIIFQNIDAYYIIQLNNEYFLHAYFFGKIVKYDKKNNLWYARHIMKNFVLVLVNTTQEYVLENRLGTLFTLSALEFLLMID